MFRTRNWVLLIVCGLDAIISAIYVTMWATGGPVLSNSWNGSVVLLGKLALLAALGTIAVAVLKSAGGTNWLLLHAVALGALGVIQYGFTHFRISILTVALVVILMPLSMEWALVQALGRQRPNGERWLLVLTGAVSAGFVVGFLALGFRWLAVGAGAHTDLLWLGSFFGFEAICMLGLSFDRSGALLSLRDPRPAH